MSQVRHEEGDKKRGGGRRGIMSGGGCKSGAYLIAHAAACEAAYEAVN